MSSCFSSVSPTPRSRRTDPTLQAPSACFSVPDFGGGISPGATPGCQGRSPSCLGILVGARPVVRALRGALVLSGWDPDPTAAGPEAGVVLLLSRLDRRVEDQAHTSLSAGREVPCTADSPS